MTSNSSGDLFIIGGNEDKEGDLEVLSIFVQDAIQNGGTIGVLTTATGYPEEVGGEYRDLFLKLGASNVELVHIDTRTKAEEDRYTQVVSSLSALFITGGDQNRLSSIIGGTTFFKEVQKAWQNGMIIAGTSAGAAIMSRHMIISGKTKVKHDKINVEIGVGFGFLEDVVIDQHFSQRARFGRLLYAIAQNPQIIGVGIDENTAIWVKDGGKYFEVIGEHSVTVIDGCKLSFVDIADEAESDEVTIAGVSLHSIAKGYQFDMEKRQLIMKEKGTAQ
ncbi:cyanophycinase [Pseudalkalibacillus berkeleyi]|uniref:Cyanophycinase n=1 Tax=Pseudalkalibacillus berkeleyi TaxID=1069813 RepID=A0ABS9H653_9BACL|nr:cyanophycinase [Pseudalkalibacillus berkeleyi]MCF6139386.1 cyanophycinase [Pseudalkalibacillus berkeleyi]